MEKEILEALQLIASKLGLIHITLCFICGAATVVAIKSGE